MSLSSARQNGRNDHLSSELTPKVMNVLALAARRMTVENAATEVHMNSPMGEWRKHPDAQPFIGMVVSENFLHAKNLALSKSQRIIEILNN